SSNIKSNSESRLSQGNEKCIVWIRLTSRLVNGVHDEVSWVNIRRVITGGSHVYKSVRYWSRETNARNVKLAIASKSYARRKDACKPHTRNVGRRSSECSPVREVDRRSCRRILNRYVVNIRVAVETEVRC